MMKSTIGAAAVALALYLGAAHPAQAASALGQVPAHQPDASVQDAYWAIGPYGRRYWVPVYRRPVYVAPPGYYRPGWHRGWRYRWYR